MSPGLASATRKSTCPESTRRSAIAPVPAQLLGSRSVRTSGARTRTGIDAEPALDLDDEAHLDSRLVPRGGAPAWDDDEAAAPARGGLTFRLGPRLIDRTQDTLALRVERPRVDDVRTEHRLRTSVDGGRSNKKGEAAPDARA